MSTAAGVGDWKPAWGAHTYLMGVVNVTPDSFSGDGIYRDPERARLEATEVTAQGADIVDIGGESTRPGYSPISQNEELSRLLPALRMIAAVPGILLSVDTSKCEVARAAVQTGVHMVNDVSGLSDPNMAAVAAEMGMWLVLVHNRPIEPGVEIITQIRRGLEALVEIALMAGVPAEHLIVDPGLGFGKGWRHNFEILRKLSALRTVGLPILVGPSRKGMIGRVLGVGPSDRLEGTVALCTIAIAHGADVVRVHDVRAMARVARMTDALVRSTHAEHRRAGE